MTKWEALYELITRLEKESCEMASDCILKDNNSKDCIFVNKSSYIVCMAEAAAFRRIKENMEKVEETERKRYRKHNNARAKLGDYI